MHFLLLTLKKITLAVSTFATIIMLVLKGRFIFDGKTVKLTVTEEGEEIPGQTIQLQCVP